MKTISSILLFLMLFSNLFAQEKETIHLWPNNVPGETEPKHPPVKTDNTKGNVTRITDITDPALVVYPANANNNNGGGVIICPGGGYNILAIDKEGYEVAEWLNTLGFSAFVLQYRVPQKQEGALQDAQCACLCSGTSRCKCISRIAFATRRWPRIRITSWKCCRRNMAQTG